MSENWDSYLCNVNDRLASVFVNLGVRSIAPDRKHEWLLWIWLKMNTPREDGLSSKEEAEVLWAIEDKLGPALESKHDLLFVGRITTQGRREFYYYCNQETKAIPEVQRALHTFPEYRFDWGTKHDPGWEQYLTLLYPTEDELQKMKNRKVFKVLEEQGDDPLAEREIRHWIYFKHETDRSRFADRVAQVGYAVVESSESEGYDDPFGICIARKQSALRESIDEAVLDLLHLAKSFNGKYDGWETEVVPKNSAPTRN